MSGPEQGTIWPRQLRCSLAAAVLVLSVLAMLTPIHAAGVADAQVKTVVIPVEGMVCFACAATVKSALKSVAGVERVEVSLEKRTARVTYAPKKLSLDQLAAAVNKTGFKAGAPKEVQ